MKQTRLDQLADGIFAIVMTLLVFKIDVPRVAGMVSDRALWQSLLAIYPVFLSYLLSFSLLYTYWRSHHLIASVLAKNIDTRFSNFNAVFFMFVALVPFSSYLLGNYSYSKTAIIFFAANIIIIGLVLRKMRQYVVKSETIENVSFTEEENRRANMHILFPVWSAFFAALISFYSTEAAIVLFTLAILFNILSQGARRTLWLLNIFRGRA